MGDSPHVSAHCLSLEGSPSQPPRQLSYSKTQTPTADPEIPAGALRSALPWVEGSPVQVLEAAAAEAFGRCPEPTAGPSKGAGFRGWGCRAFLSPSRSAWPQASFLAGLPPARFSVPHGDSLTINYPFPLKTARDGFCCNSESWPWDGCFWGVVREEAAWGPCDVSSHGGSDGEEPTCNDLGSIPGSGRSPGEGNGYPLQYSCLGIPWTEEPGGLQSKGLQRVRHDWMTNTLTLNKGLLGHWLYNNKT